MHTPPNQLSAARRAPLHLCHQSAVPGKCLTSQDLGSSWFLGRGTSSAKFPPRVRGIVARGENHKQKHHSRRTNLMTMGARTCTFRTCQHVRQLTIITTPNHANCVHLHVEYAVRTPRRCRFGRGQLQRLASCNRRDQPKAHRWVCLQHRAYCCTACTRCTPPVGGADCFHCCSSPGTGLLEHRNSQSS